MTTKIVNKKDADTTMAFRKLLGGVVCAQIGGAGYGYYWATTNLGEDAVERIMRYDKVVMPMILQYKWLEAKCEKLPKILPSIFPPVSFEEEQRQFEVLHKKFAPAAVDIHMELGGFYYKSGQKIASNMGGISPKPWIDAFQPFLNDIPARDPKEVRTVLEEGLGKKREEVFSSWEEEPLGCASIGQVHRATLRSSGEKVVVKVQNPNAEQTFRGDVFALRTLIDMFMPQLSVAFDEIQKQFATEFDYRGECQNAIDIRNNLKHTFPDVIVPKVYSDLCSQRVMVMEEVEKSEPLHDVLKKQLEKLAKQRGVSTEEFMTLEKKRMHEEAKQLKGQMAPSISAESYDAYIKLQQGRYAASYAYRTAYNWTLGWVLPNYDMKALDDEIIVPLNACRLIDLLFRTHGHEVLVDGCFNADPHPGNILCTEGGQIALIDYGQVKRISMEQRVDFAKSILLVEAALKLDPRVNENVDEDAHRAARQSVVAHAVKSGMRTEKMLDDTFYEMCVVYFGRMDQPFLYPDNALQWTDKIQEQDPIGNIDDVDYLVMVNTNSMMLRGLGEMLGQPRNLAKAWAPLARQLLREQGKLVETDEEIANWTKKV